MGLFYPAIAIFINLWECMSNSTSLYKFTHSLHDHRGFINYVLKILKIVQTLSLSLHEHRALINCILEHF